MSRLSIVALFAFTACVASPYSGQVVTSTTVPFDGFAHASGAQVTIEAYNWNTATFEYVGGAVAATSPTFTAGVFCPNSPELFRFSRSVSLNSNYWKMLSGKNTARVRAAQLKNGTRNGLMFTANPSGTVCMTKNANTQTCDFWSVSYNTCGYNLDQATITR